MRGVPASAISSGDKTQITVVVCVSAAGYCIPPMVIWDRKILSPELTHGEVPGTIYGLSKNGWMDMELFDLWFTNHFLRFAPAARPILLLLDGHSSHYCPDAVRLAAQEQVILFTLPPNTTHLSQPLDKGCFSSQLKVAWKEACHHFLTINPGKVVTRYQFSMLFSQAWMKSMTVSNICAGFRVTGVHPLNRNVFSPMEDPPLVKESGLAFIPLYSPATQRTKHHASEHRESTPVYLDESSTCDDIISESADTSSVWLQAPQCSAVSRFLRCPFPVNRQKTFHPKSCGRVLTSTESLRQIAEKEQAKQEKEKKEIERMKAKEERKGMLASIGN